MVRTYVVRDRIDSAFAIWNDEQLVVFVQEMSIGTSATLMRQLVAPIAFRVGVPSLQPRQALAGQISAIRVEHGVVMTPTPLMSTSPLGLFLFEGARPQFVKQRPLVAGGFWNGTGIDRLAPSDYLRLVGSHGPDDMGSWHRARLIAGVGTPEVRVHLKDDAFTLKCQRRGDDAVIDLVRDGASSIRLFEGRSTERQVSARDYEAIFGDPSRH